MRRCLAVGLAALAAVSCSHAPKPFVIKNTKDHWTVSMPGEFKADAAKLPEGVQRFLGPKESGEQPTIVIISTVGDKTAKEAADEIVKDPGPGLSIQSSSPYDLPGASGYSIIATQNNGATTQRQIYFVVDRTAVILTLTSPTSDYEKWNGRFEESLKSFQWTGSAKKP